MAVTTGTWRGLDACIVEGDHLRVVVTRIGAQIASLQHIDRPVELLWQPPWEGARPDRADARWGPPEEAPLLAAICGWNLCCDRFGASPPADGRPLHGEAGVRPWRLETLDDGAGILARVTLPKAGLEVRRRIRLDGDRLEVDTTVAAVDAAEHAIDCCEHITLGDPLIDGCEVWLPSVGTAMMHPDPAAHAAPRAGISAGDAVAPEAVLPIPAADAQPCGDIAAVVAEHGRWRIANPRLGLTVQCQWDRSTLPFVCLWTEHLARTDAPWGGKTRARGMELASKPFPEAERNPQRHPEWRGHRSICTVAPGAPARLSVALEVVVTGDRRERGTDEGADLPGGWGARSATSV